MSKLVTLQVWARTQFGEDAPFIGTLRRWAREGKLYPAPKKHGRAYYLREDAEYVSDYNDSDFMRKVRASTPWK
ncbi:excisionase [Caballeronia mineralivorans]|jgi:hypothetical protein|uniref:excisionase n=1 Tax=Caballeronia mineralivorans TaxID=2010198 RepID=UPI0023F12BC3|nr:excisionase [Caballeronia mineralivorans]MDB5782057.1 Excisionase domain protein [Caballeronia mineralivorans]